MEGDCRSCNKLRSDRHVCCDCRFSRYWILSGYPSDKAIAFFDRSFRKLSDGFAVFYGERCIGLTVNGKGYGKELNEFSCCFHIFSRYSIGGDLRISGYPSDKAIAFFFRSIRQLFADRFSGIDRDHDVIETFRLESHRVGLSSLFRSFHRFFFRGFLGRICDFLRSIRCFFGFFSRSFRRSF